MKSKNKNTIASVRDYILDTSLYIKNKNFHPLDPRSGIKGNGSNHPLDPIKTK